MLKDYRRLLELLRLRQEGAEQESRRLMYDFEAQGSDELMSKEGDEVYIVNESKSKDWWMCQNVETKRQGVIPSSYIEIVGTSNLEKLAESLSKTKSPPRSARSSRGRVVQNDDLGHRKSKNHHRTREERNKIRENDGIPKETNPATVIQMINRCQLP